MVSRAVLHEAIDGARALAGAGCGVIATVDEPGRDHDFAASGFTEEELPQLPGVRSVPRTARWSRWW